MQVNNDWYDDLGDTWWDTDGVVGPLHEINPTRLAYFCCVVGNLRGLRLLEIGGGGLMSEEYASQEASVIGIDRSGPSIRIAAKYTAETRLTINCVPAVGERLPFADCSFDAIVSADTLEHADDVDLVIDEANGWPQHTCCFAYDTVNRTWKSRMLLVWLPQNVFQMAPPDTHDYERFFKPAELQAVMARHGLENCEARGLALKLNLVRAAISFARANRPGRFQIGNDTGMSHVGYAQKAA